MPAMPCCPHPSSPSRTPRAEHPRAVPRRSPLPSLAPSMTYRFPLLAGGTHEATLAPVTLRRPGKRAESGTAPGTTTNPVVPWTHLHPGDTWRSLLTPRSRLTLRGGKKKTKPKPRPAASLAFTCHHLPFILPRGTCGPVLVPCSQAKGCRCKEVLDTGLEKWPQGLPHEEAAGGGRGKRKVGVRG